MGGLLPAKKVGFVKSSTVMDVGFERWWIVMTLYESQIIKLQLGLVVYNHLGSFPLIASFSGKFLPKWL